MTPGNGDLLVRAHPLTDAWKAFCSVFGASFLRSAEVKMSLPLRFAASNALSKIAADPAMLAVSSGKKTSAFGVASGFFAVNFSVTAKSFAFLAATKIFRAASLVETRASSNSLLTVTGYESPPSARCESRTLCSLDISSPDRAGGAFGLLALFPGTLPLRSHCIPSLEAMRALADQLTVQQSASPRRVRLATSTRPPRKSEAARNRITTLRGRHDGARHRWKSQRVRLGSDQASRATGRSEIGQRLHGPHVAHARTARRG